MVENNENSRPNWLVWSGVASLALATFCLAWTAARILATYDSIADSPTSPRPSDLANGLSDALLPSFAAIPIGILGLVLLVAGLVLSVRKEQ